MPRHAGDGFIAKKISAVLDIRFDAIRLLPQIQRQVELSRSSLGFEELADQITRRGIAGQVAAQRAKQLEVDLKERVMTSTPLRLELTHQFLERVVQIGRAHV